MSETALFISVSEWFSKLTPSEWLTLFSAIGSLIAIAVSAVWRAWLYSRESKEREWRRLQELLVLIYNKDYNSGGWAQLAAIDEIVTLRIKRKVIIDLLGKMILHWEKNNEGKNVVNKLKEAVLLIKK